MHWIVHIGAPKTGSTALQSFLVENMVPLLDHGIRYPDVSLRGDGHHDLAFLLGGGYPPWASQQGRTLEELGVALRDDVRAHKADTIVISSENFYLYPDPSALRTLLQSTGMRAGDRMSVVCYVRRQDDAHISWYNQTVKAQGNTAGFARSVRRDHALWDYADRLKPWQAEFGTRAVVVRDYAALADDDVRTDFAGIIGLPRTAFVLPPLRPNGRINRDILEFQRMINFLPLSPRLKRRYHRQFIALTSATSNLDIFDDAPFLTHAQRIALVETYARGNSIVARTFMGRVDLFGPIPATACRHRRRGLTPAKIAFISRWLFSHRAL